MRTDSLTAVCWLIFLVLNCPAFGQLQGEEVEALGNEPQPLTTADPSIPTEHLELLVKPLTKEELILEADGWRDLLKANAQAIAMHRIGVKEQQAVVDEAETTLTATEEMIAGAGSTSTTCCREQAIARGMCSAEVTGPQFP